MPNFDDFERLVRRAMVARESDMSSFATSFNAIPTANRPSLFKAKSESDFAAWLTRSRACLRTLYDAEEFRTSNRNAVGADITVLESGLQIELKTGAVTDANLGVGTIAWAMGDKSENKELRDIMDGPEMLKRRNLAQNGKYADVKASQEATMIALEAYFRARISQGQDAPGKLAHLSRCVARGITKQNDMKQLINKTESNWNAPDILHANWTNRWERIAHPFSVGESIVIESVFRGSHGDGNDTVGRAQVILEGEISKQRARIYPNYKNSYGKGSSKFEARNWVATACFHVWITPA